MCGSVVEDIVDTVKDVATGGIADTVIDAVQDVAGDIPVVGDVVNAVAEVSAPGSGLLDTAMDVISGEAGIGDVVKDVVGDIPVVGDAVETLMNAGDIGDVAKNLASEIPGVGDAVEGILGGEGFGGILDAIEKTGEVLQSEGLHIEGLAEGLSEVFENLSEAFENVDMHNGAEGGLADMLGGFAEKFEEMSGTEQIDMGAMDFAAQAPQLEYIQ